MPTAPRSHSRPFTAVLAWKRLARNPLSGFDPPRDTSVPVRILSRYELLEEIGRGNMGVVYRARDPEMDRDVAIKVVRLGFSLDDAQRRASFWNASGARPRSRESSAILTSSRCTTSARGMSRSW